MGEKKKTQEMENYIKGYMSFLDAGKTEREAAAQAISAAETAGFCDLEEAFKEGRELKAGDKVYILSHGKAVGLFVIGKKPLQEGMRILCSHIDSPRLDIKARPLYGADGLALFKTHYYGGLKKYQWVAQPLSLHGVVITKKGESVRISIGENPDEPVFYISDLPAHLSNEQDKKTMENGVEGEFLNAIVGCGLGSAKDKADDKTDGNAEMKKKILKILKDCYKIEEKELATAELELVPAGKARHAGFDSSMIASYGHDDRICAYGALKAILEADSPEYTSAVILADKEEVGSQGNTGMNSHLMENIVAKLVWLCGGRKFMDMNLALERSIMLSADVTLAYDPTYPEVFEKANTAKLGEGPAVIKYSGHGGKSGASDASAELLAFVCGILDEADVPWQTGELGKIDAGGGGTISQFAARYGMEVLDLGVALLSMHAQYELASKSDAYEFYRAMKAFLAADKSFEY